ncbi:MAG: phosphonate C-P lyase system protein PhnH [Hyphomicrobiales bacterium]|nr:phosphonate C-P lyase system protein PhnH [Hyphomicrobiales bacterium]MDE2115638.1 phosphonate C-P lyase system protein PhnH [Hyphomicrobiales bacterium]
MSHGPGAGFKNPVFDSQRLFRQAMMALATPGQICEMAMDAEPPAPFMAAMAGLALCLVDFETPLWLDAAFDRPEVLQYLRFHTGARFAPKPDAAAFALIGHALAMPNLSDFSLGTLENPHRSTDLFIQVEYLSNGEGPTLAGPGVAVPIELRAGPLPRDFWAQRLAMQRHFPCGLDIYFVCGNRLAAVPRSTRLMGDLPCM